MVVNRDGFYFIDVTWKTGFSHKVPCRGYSLKSQMAFNDSLFWIESHSFYEVTQQEYEDYLWGSGSAADIEKTTSKSTTRSPRKNGVREVKVVTKSCPTKQCVKPATKSTKKKAPSATPIKKRSSGSTTTGNKL